MIDNNIIRNFIEKTDGEHIVIEYDCDATAVYGLGERYCSVNHIGKKLKSLVIEQFCEQGEIAYLPMPFYHANDGHGVFVETAYEVNFDFSEGHFRILMSKDAEYKLHFIYGTPKEIIAQFIEMTGEIVLPPKWAFGVWASANRWNCQKDIEEQMEYAKKYDYPISVVVIEAWSDEATFYLWNGSKYDVVDGGEFLKKENIQFDGPWPSPDKMIEELHNRGMKLVLWQIPALKELDPGQVCAQHDNDCAYAVEHKLVGTDLEGNPYKIPRQWFIGSMLPDFANPKTREWWFAKRQYLLDMGVDGFKTDGGEFVHDVETLFYDGRGGKEVKNLYPAQYEKAYAEFAGKDRVLFSRAGYLGAQTTPMHWAGDQKSKFSELQSVLKAGLSLGLSGVPFWSFDIGGFAGPMPTKELYLRSTALAAFVPAMQWHSEPASGQFAEIMKGTIAVNDRSPWNMVEYCGGDNEILEVATYFANIHMNFLPYFYKEAEKCAMERAPFMKHLYLEYPQDKNVWKCEDTYMVGEMLIAPVISEGDAGRSVYLPEGMWYNFWDGSKIMGTQEIYVDVPYNRIPLFVREGATLTLNLGKTGKVGETVGNDIESIDNYVSVTFDETLCTEEYCQKLF